MADLTKTFDFDKANLADQLGVVEELEHAYSHLLKTASTLEEGEAVFYLTTAQMVKDFRREFMREHFPNVEDKDWCLVKAFSAVKQRIYESANTSYKDLKTINELWALVMEHIFGVDMSDCVACTQDKGEENEYPEKKTNDN